MSDVRGFKQKLASISRKCERDDYDAALAEVESALKVWPGNAHLQILWASIVQLQEHPEHELEDVKRALQNAVDLDQASPAAAIELGYFLDNVQDDPRAAAKVYTEAVAAARHLLVDGLIGHAKALRQLGKTKEFRRCLLEVLRLTRFEAGPGRKGDESEPDLIFESPTGHFHAVQLQGPYSEQIQDLLSDVVAQHARVAPTRRRRSNGAAKAAGRR